MFDKACALLLVHRPVLTILRRFRPEILVCRPRETRSCLQNTTLHNLQRLYSPTAVGRDYIFPPSVPGSEYAYDRDHYWRNSVEDSHDWGLEDHYRYFVLNNSAHWRDSTTWDRTVEEGSKVHDDTVERLDENWDNVWDLAVQESLEDYQDKDELPEDVWDMVAHLEHSEEITMDDKTIELGITINPGQADVSPLCICAWEPNAMPRPTAQI
jgi:hypothetical protein